MVNIIGLCAGYDKREILHNINCQFEKGKLTAIVGPNGSGKSTLLKSLVRLIDVRKGEILINETSIKNMSSIELARHISYLPQNKQIPDISILKMVLNGRFCHLNYPRHYKSIDYEIAENALSYVDLSSFKDKNMCQLSGGTQQKAFIAMCLAQCTPVIILDEPLSYLDISHQLNFINLLKDLADEGKTIIVVIHDLLMALKYFDNILVLNDGCVRLSGNTNEIYESKVLDEVFNVNVKRNSDTKNTIYFYD